MQNPGERIREIDERLEQTAEDALKQIEEKAYEKGLLMEGIPKENIYKLGFAFKGKDVYILHEKYSEN